MTGADRIEHADARQWLARQEPGAASVVLFDPPYSRNRPMRGREDGAAGSVFGPFGFMSQVMPLCHRALRPCGNVARGERGGGVVIAFCDVELMPDMGWIATTSGLKYAGCLSWCRSNGGGGGIFRGAWSPVMLFSRGSPDRVDKANVKNWIVADPPGGNAKEHPYQKPIPLLEYILRRVCGPGDMVLDPFAGSGSSRTACANLKLDLIWRGCDIDPAYAEDFRSQPAPGDAEGRR